MIRVYEMFSVEALGNSSRKEVGKVCEKPPEVSVSCIICNPWKLSRFSTSKRNPPSMSSVLLLEKILTDTPRSLSTLQCVKDDLYRFSIEENATITCPSLCVPNRLQDERDIRFEGSDLVSDELPFLAWKISVRIKRSIVSCISLARFRECPEVQLRQWDICADEGMHFWSNINRRGQNIWLI